MAEKAALPVGKKAAANAHPIDLEHPSRNAAVGMDAGVASIDRIMRHEDSYLEGLRVLGVLIEALPDPSTHSQAVQDGVTHMRRAFVYATKSAHTDVGRGGSDIDEMYLEHDSRLRDALEDLRYAALQLNLQLIGGDHATRDTYAERLRQIHDVASAQLSRRM